MAHVILAALMAAALQAAPVADSAGPAKVAPDPQAEAAGLAWITAAGHPLSGADAGSDELAPIAAQLKDARIIGVGEVTHGDHEDQRFKAALIEELVREGAVTTVAIEANRDVARTFDAYATRGEGDPMALMRSTSFFRVFRDEEFAGLLVWLRAWNQVATQPVHIIGIDDQDAGRDAAFALGMIARHDRKLAAALRTPFGALIPAAGQDYPKAATWVMGQTTASIAALKNHAKAVADTISAHKDSWGSDPDYAEAAYAAETAWQCFDIFEREGTDADPKTPPPSDYYARRDKHMAQNLVARLGANDHAALWAHNFHVMAVLPEGMIADGTTTVGRELRNQLGQAYRNIGFTYSHGHIDAVVGAYDTVKSADPEAVVEVPNDRPGELGSVFARTGLPALWIDLRARPHTPLLDQWNATEYQTGATGWAVDPNHWQDDPPSAPDHVVQVDEGFDLLVWFRTITPARRLPIAPAPISP